MLWKRTALIFYNVCRSLHNTQTNQVILDSCSTTKLFNNGNVSQKTTGFLSLRKYTSSGKPNKNDTTEMAKVQPGVGKYKIFSDFDSPIILDIDEERQLRQHNPELFEEEEKLDELAGINIERGVNGVFDIEELVDILRKEKALNICVIFVPPEYQYVDHMVVVSGKSLKHLRAMAEFIRKLYKRKKSENDYFPIIEGKNSEDWMALDLGNIALHFQTNECRKKYDIEMLWSLGPKYDDKVNQKEDEYICLLKQHTALADLEPLDADPPTQSNTLKADITNKNFLA